MRSIDPRLAAIAVGNFAHGSATMGLIGLLNEIADDLDVSIATAGQLTTGMQLTAAICAPIVGFFGGALSRRTVLVAALVLTALCQISAAFAPTFLALLVARTISGLASAAYAPTAVVTASHLVPPERRSSAIAIVVMGFSLAGIVGVPLGVWLGGAFGWRFAMAGFGILAIAALAGIALTVPGRVEGTAQVDRSAWRSVFGNRAMMLTVAFNLVQGAAQMAFYAYIAPLLRAGLDAGPGTISLILAWTGFCGLVGSLLTIRLIDRLGPARVMRFGLAAMLATFALWPLAAQSTAFVLVLLGLYGTGSIMTFSSVQAQIVRIDHRIASAAMPVLSSTNFGGGVLGAAIGGAVIATLGLSAISWTATGLVVAALGILRLLGPSSRPQAAHG